MSLILLYGLNILTIYLNLFYFASRQINISDTDPWKLILIVGILYLLFGALAAMNWSGMLNGVDMNIRAILVVAGFSGISTELKNPLITNFLVQKGFRQLYLAISLAFSALPAMMEEISQPRRFFSRPFSSIRNLVSAAPLWLETLSHDNNSSPGNK